MPIAPRDPGEDKARPRALQRPKQDGADARKALATEIIQRVGRTPNLPGWQDLAREYGIEPPASAEAMSTEFLSALRDAIVSGVR